MLFRSQGWDQQIATHLRYGGKLIGVCGGYQMLGELIVDEVGIESQQISSNGLGYIPMVTKLEAEKQLRLVQGHIIAAGFAAAVAVQGYEIHVGQSTLHGDGWQALLQLDDGRTEGLIASDGQIIGTYLHGLFDQLPALTALLAWAGWQGAIDQLTDADAQLDTEIDRLADALDMAMDLQKVASLGL